jgi:hypothetical protein
MAERGVGGPDEQQPGDPRVSKNVPEQMSEDAVSSALREDVLRTLDGRIRAARTAGDKEYERRLQEQMEIWQDDIRELRRRSGAEVELKIVAGDHEPDFEQIVGADDPSGTGTVELPERVDTTARFLQIRHLYEHLEPSTRDVREILPTDWAGLHVMHIYRGLTHDIDDLDLSDPDDPAFTESLETALIREKALRLFIDDLDQFRDRMTKLYKPLMASRGIYIMVDDEGGDDLKDFTAERI